MDKAGWTPGKDRRTQEQDLLRHISCANRLFAQPVSYATGKPLSYDPSQRVFPATSKPQELPIPSPFVAESSDWKKTRPKKQTQKRSFARKSTSPHEPPFLNKKTHKRSFVRKPAFAIASFLCFFILLSMFAPGLFPKASLNENKTANLHLNGQTTLAGLLGSGSIPEYPNGRPDMPETKDGAEKSSLLRGEKGYPTVTVQFPGLHEGFAYLQGDALKMHFELDATQAVLFMNNRGLRLPIVTSEGILGTLNILFDDACKASVLPSETGKNGTPTLCLLWQKTLKPGQKSHFAQVVLTFTKVPEVLDSDSLASIQPASLVGTQEAPMKNTSAAALAPLQTAVVEYRALAQTRVMQQQDQTGKNGAIVQTPVKTNGVQQKNPIKPKTLQQQFATLVVKSILEADMNNNGSVTFRFAEIPSPVSGMLLQKEPDENLRYISSDFILEKDYQPKLTWVSAVAGMEKGEAFQFQSAMVSDLKAMLSEAKNQGMQELDFENSYRSYTWQKNLYDRRLNLSKTDKFIPNPLAATLRRVARPNGSEHQSGMAFDISTKKARLLQFADTPEYQYLMHEGWQYGFVVRYPDGWEPVTGVMFEPWHIRYLGRPMASYLYHEKVPYESFVADAVTNGSVWLGNKDEESTYLAVPMQAGAQYSASEDGIAPKISTFFGDHQLWLIEVAEHNAAR